MLFGVRLVLLQFSPAGLVLRRLLAGRGAGKSKFGPLAALISILFALLPALPVAAQTLNSLRFTQLGMEEGLPSPYVASSLQDGQGLIWLGTTNGLARYDGRSVRSFFSDPARPDTLSHAVIQSLLEDKRRQLIWVGSRGGLDRLDLKTERVKRLPAPAELSPRERRLIAMAPAVDGRLWLAYMGGLYLFDPDTEQFMAWSDQPQVPAANPAASAAVDAGVRRPQFITTMISDGRDGVWLARGEAVMHIGAGAKAVTPGRSFVLEANASSRLRQEDLIATCMALDAAGRLWVGSNGGLRTWRVDADSVRPDPLAQTLQLSDQAVHALLLDRDKSMWIGQGDVAVLYRWREGAEALESFRHLPGVSGSLASDTIASLMQDRTGVLWVGSTDAGVNLVDLSGQGFSNYLSIPGDEQSLSSPVVMATLLDGPAHAWVGTYGGGLNHLHLPTGRASRISLKEMPISHVKALAPAANGKVWVGGDRGLVLFDPAARSSKRIGFESLGGSAVSVSDLLPDEASKDAAGGIWIASAMGLYRLEADMALRRYRSDAKQAGSLVNNIVDSLLRDRDGRLWVGSKGGLQFLDAAGDRFSDPVPVQDAAPGQARPAVHDMRQDGQGRIWLATNQGLFELQAGGGGGDPAAPAKAGGHTWRLLPWRSAPGMPAGGFDSIQDAQNGEIWLGSDQGLTRFQPAQRQARFFGARGNFGRGFNFAAATRGPDGSLYFGGPGLVRFKPEQLRDNPQAPAVVLSDLLVLNRSLLGDDGAALRESASAAASRAGVTLADLGVGGPLHLAKAITLSPREAMVSFEMAALHFDRVKLNRYAWMLVGFDRDWIFGRGNLGLATYTNLDAGRYRLRVKAANPDGVWGEPSTLLELEVQPPWWRTWWWRGSLLLMLALAFTAAYRWRMRALRQTQLMLEAEVGTRTQQLAAEKSTALAQREVAEKARRDIGLLSEIGRQITATLDVDSIQQTLYKHVQELLNASVFGVGRLDRRERTLNFDFVMQRGQAFKPYKRSLDAVDQPAVRCALEARELCIAELTLDNRELGGILEAPRRVQLQSGAEPLAARSAIYVPMLIKGQVTGVISVLSDRPAAFGPADLDILRTLGAYAAVALDNAEAYRQLQLTQAKLVEQEKLAALGSLVAGVAHELNTPIGNSLLVASTVRDVSAKFLQRLQDGGLRRSELEQFCQGNQESASLLLRSLDQAAHLVTSFKQLAVDQTSEQRRQFELRKLCEEVALTLGNRLRQGEHELRLEFAEDIEMDSFPGPLGQVLTNLIINALVHGLEGRRKGLLVLSAQRQPGVAEPGEQDGGSVKLVFSDDGCGIAADNLSRIFEPFFTTKLGHGGSGLGLHICYNIVSGVLGGSIAASSEPGEGARFTIIIPCVAPR